jgi:curli production assembly/transport component CsgF
MRRELYVIGAALGCFSWCSTGLASQLVYQPTNPTFGGNPLNGSFLLSTAQAQGLGTKSGSNGPDLSGLDNALSNLGNVAAPTIIIGAPQVPANP